MKIPATDLDRIDIRWNDGHPTLYGWTADGRTVSHQLTPSRQLALLKTLASYLLLEHRPTHDRTHESRKATAAHPTHDGKAHR